MMKRLFKKKVVTNEDETPPPATAVPPIEEVGVAPSSVTAASVAVATTAWQGEKLACNTKKTKQDKEQKTRKKEHRSKSKKKENEDKQRSKCIEVRYALFALCCYLWPFWINNIKYKYCGRLLLFVNGRECTVLYFDDITQQSTIDR